MQPSALRLGNLVLVCCLLALTACGFHLRGLEDLSFHSLYIQGNSSILRDLKRAVATNGVKIVPTPEQAELHLDLMSESSEKRILSLTGGGHVSEYELIYRVNFRTRPGGSELWGPPQQFEGRRDYTFDDTLLLAKEGEEARLYNDMRADATREIVRRLSVQTAGSKPDASN